MSNDPSDDPDLEDDEFWNLEQSDELSTDLSPQSAPDSTPHPADAFALPEDSHPTVEANLSTAPPDSPELIDIEKNVEKEDTKEPDLKQKAEADTTEADQSTSAASKTSSWSMVEKLSVAGFFALLALLVNFFVSQFFQQTTIAEQYNWKDTLPASGERIHLEAVETQWKEASDPDVRFGVEFVPSITLTLSPKSVDGYLRVGFRNYDGKPVGDSKMESIRNGKFDNGTTQKTIHCTDGLLDEAALRGYLAQNEKRWSVHLQESASRDTSLNEGKALGQMSISPKFLDH